MPPAGNKPPRCGSPRELEGRPRPDSGRARCRRVPAAIPSTFLRWSVSSSAGWARLFSGWDETLAGRHVFTFLTLAAPLWDESWGRGPRLLPAPHSVVLPQGSCSGVPGGGHGHITTHAYGLWPGHTPDTWTYPGLHEVTPAGVWGVRPRMLPEMLRCRGTTPCVWP